MSRTDPPSFAHLPDTLRPLAMRGVVRRWRAGALLIDEGEQDDTLHIVLAGRLRVYAVDERGREITFGTYGPGEYVGEMALDGGPRSASVSATEATVTAMVTKRSLLDHLRAEPEFALELLAKVIGRTRAATLTAKQLALNDVYGRVKFTLEQLAAPAAPDGTRSIEPRPTHRELASLAGSSREMVSRVMKDLENGGFVAAPSRSVLVLLRPLPLRW